MTTRILLDSSTFSNPAFRGISGGGPIAWLRVAAARWRERRILETLDDRTLHDIGISRSQALAEACKPFWKQ
jgi:uncharacterized protein YjiS (DUF1127 family)